MTLYARIDNGLVCEFLDTPFDLTDSKTGGGLTWLDVSGVQPKPLIGWVWNGTNFTAPAAYAPTFEEAKAVLDYTLSLKEAAGVTFEVSGTAYTFATDNVSQLKALAANSMVAQGLWQDGTLWLSASGQAVAMTSEQAGALTLAMLGYIKSCEANYAALLSGIQSNTSADITVNWPSQDLGGS